MPSDEKDLSELERALGGLEPSRADFDRDRVMFQAGQASAPRWLLWPAAAGLMTAVAASLGLFLVLRPAAEPVVQVVYRERPIVAPQPAPAPPESPEPQPAPEREGSTAPSVFAMSSYWRLQEIAVRHGIDELPDSAPAGAAGPAPNAATTLWDWRSRPATASSLYHSGVE
jgi:hypothetical protein